MPPSWKSLGPCDADEAGGPHHRCHDEQGYAEGHRALMDLAELGGARTVVCVPMLNDNELVGAITIYNKEVRPFSDKQIELSTISPNKPSSPSRTRGCSTSCASAPTISPRHWSSKRRRRKCSVSFPARRRMFNQCSMQ